MVADVTSLTDKQRACLRGIYNLRTVGQIASDLGMAESTVRGHLDAANKRLGTRRTADAALLLRAFEQDEHPRNLPDTDTRVDSPAPAEPEPSQPAVPWSHRLPIRPRGATGNHLTPLQRLVWIPLIALLIVIGFGTLANGLEVLTRTIERLQHLTS